MTSTSIETTRKSIQVNFLRNEPLARTSSEWASNTAACGGCGKNVSWVAPLLEVFNPAWVPSNHHCRNCGLTFCDECCKVRLPFSCGDIQRVCIDCSKLVDHQTAAQNIQLWFRQAKKKKELKTLLETSRDALQKREHQVNKLEEENEKLGEDLVVAQTEIRSLWEAQSETQQQLSELAKVLSSGEGEPDDLHTAVHARMSVLEGTITDLRSEVTSLGSSNHMLVEKNQSLARCNSSLVSLNNELTVRTSKLADRVEQLLSVKVDLQERNVQLLHTNDEYKSEISGLKTDNMSLEIQNRRLSESNVQLTEQNSSLCSDIVVLRDTVNSTNRNLERVRRDLTNKDKMIENRNQEIQELTTRETSLTAQNERQDKALKTLGSKVRNANAAEQSLKSRVHDLEGAIREVSLVCELSDDPILMKKLADLKERFGILGDSVAPTDLNPQPLFGHGSSARNCFEGFQKRPGYFRGKSLDPEKIKVRATMNTAHKQLNDEVTNHMKRLASTDKTVLVDETSDIFYPKKPAKLVEE